MKNVYILKREIKNLKKGEKIFINVINLSPKSVIVLREMIQNGILIPDAAEVKKLYKNEKVVMKGLIILPQMLYTKN